MLRQLAARKSVAAIAREIEAGPRLNRVLSARTLTSIGLGSMIGSGIFVLTGTVAADIMYSSARFQPTNHATPSPRVA